ncbi:unnamed protein product [Aureobasidium mustum]|uniref:Uncharacterized protein n=1 Tax=Aureobasidium mustum TaxID=2773714 RepID=A0A9N8JXM5_9PEZI|nr:unnamed protein product [Aureobasidium mustum]
MPAPLAKGILISLSILAAVGIAVYENPQVKEWVEEQRRKITEFLRTFGDELDPQSRREAEAFAYEGRLPTQTREEAAGTASAIARATGRETTDDSITRRNRTSLTPQSPDEAEERRRLGREYLAKRNQEMLDLKEKQKMRRSTSGLSDKTPPSPTFDQLVNVDGSLKTDEKNTQEEGEEFNEKTLDLPSVPTDEPKSLRSIPVQEANVVETAFNTGSRYANPFGDEFELSGTLDSRSPTPKPPVPPKIAIEDTNKVRRLSVTQKSLRVTARLPAIIPAPMVIPPYDPVHEAAAAPTQQESQTPHHPHTPTTATFSSPEVERDAISFSSASSTTDDFASAPASVAASEMSLIDFGEVESVDSGEESEPDGVLTPGSWTDVGSDVGSEDQENHRLA